MISDLRKSTGTTSGGGGGLLSQQVFDVAGQWTWTKPAGVAKIRVIVTGGGGGGRNAHASFYMCGGGGQAGGTAIKIIDVSAIPGEIITVGTGGVSSGDGNTSSFGNHCSATGGHKGALAGTAGSDPEDPVYEGGIGLNGDINIRGGQGGQGSGGTAVNESTGQGGGASYWGGGGMSSNSAGSYTGGNGRSFGSGGGGGDWGNARQDGGNGKSGIIVVEEYGQQGEILLPTNPSRFNAYMPTGTPYTTPQLLANTPTKLVVPLIPKTAKDFSFDTPNLRQYFDAPGVTGRWFIVHSSATVTVSTPNQTVTVETYVNGVIVEGIGIDRFMASAADVGSLISIGTLSLSHLDYVEIFVTLTSAGTITFKRLSVTLNEIVGVV